MARYTASDFLRTDLEPTSAPTLQEMFEEARQSFAEEAVPAAPVVPAASPVSAVQPDARPGAQTRSGVAYWLMAVFTGVCAITALVSVSLVLIRGPGQPSAPHMTLPAATAAATALPTLPSVPTRPALAPGLAVYFAPAGDLAPSLNATTDYTPTGRFHQDWVQLAVTGYAQAVWARSDSVPEVALESLPDLAPPPTATPAPLVIVREIPIPVPVACTRENAVAIKTQDVTNTKGVPIGHAEAWSCTSEADADAQLQAQIAEIQQRAMP